MYVSLLKKIIFVHFGYLRQEDENKFIDKKYDRNMEIISKRII